MNAGRKVFVESDGYELAVSARANGAVDLGHARPGRVEVDVVYTRLNGGARIAGFLRWVLVEVLGAAAEAGIEVPLDSALAARLFAGVDLTDLEKAQAGWKTADAEGSGWTCVGWDSSPVRQSMWHHDGEPWKAGVSPCSVVRGLGATRITELPVSAGDLALLRGLASFAPAGVADDVDRSGVLAQLAVDEAGTDSESAGAPYNPDVWELRARLARTQGLVRGVLGEVSS